MATKTEGREHVNVWVEPELVRQLDEKAQEADRSRSAEIRVLLREGLARGKRAEERER